MSNQRSFYVSAFEVFGVSYIAIPGVENDCLTVYCQGDASFNALAAFEESALLSWVEWHANDATFYHHQDQLLEHLNSNDMFAIKEGA